MSRVVEKEKRNNGDFMTSDLQVDIPVETRTPIDDSDYDRRGHHRAS